MSIYSSFRQHLIVWLVSILVLQRTHEAGPDAGQTERVYAHVRRLGGVQTKRLALLPFR